LLSGEPARSPPDPDDEPVTATEGDDGD